MAESTLSLSKDAVEGEIGFFLGFGRGPANGEENWDANKLRTIASLSASAQRQFYFTPPIDSNPGGYSWSFLRPVATLTFWAGAQTLELPDDFGGFEGDITVLSTTGCYWPIRLTNEGLLRAEYAKTPSVTGRPRMGAELPLKGTTLLGGQRKELMLFPTADQDYTLQAAYYLLPDALDGTRPYIYGGMQHTETVLASAKAAAELHLDDMKGPQWQNFTERLASSISIDQRNKAALIGYNGDRSDGADRLNRRWMYNQSSIRYNGAQY